MKTNKFFLSLFLAAMMCVPFRAGAQVTIGSGVPPREFSVLELFSDGERGLRLPQMTTEQRNDMRDAFLAGNYYELANGLIIFNTTSNCVEYWNGTHWISLCEGNSQKTVYPEPCLAASANGDDCDYYFQITDPDCEDGPFFFTVVAGSDFVFFAYTNESDGIFRLSFMPNNSIRPRSAIVRVTSECTSLSRDFLFTQLGQECPPDLPPAPRIIVSNDNTELCIGGAVYLWVPANTPNPERLIWTRNGIEVERGVTHLLVTQPGRYNLYLDFIGCGAYRAEGVLIAMGTTVAPAPVSIISGANNGFVCNVGETTPIFVGGTVSGTAVWYRDGIRTAETGLIIEAGIGDWFVVVEDGSCSSMPSNVVQVRLHPDAEAGGSVSPFSIKINGEPAGGNIELCSSGTLFLAVDNPEPGVVYTWFAGDQANGVTLGTGIAISTTVAAVRDFPIIQVVGSGANVCSQAAFTQFTFSISNAPATPVITSNTGQTMCGTSTVLTASSADVDSFIWYRDGIRLPHTSSTIPITATGLYWVYGVSGNCRSLRSAGFNIGQASGFPGNLMITGSSTPYVNTTMNYIATMDNAQGAEFIWTVPAPHTILSGQGTPFVVVGIADDTAPFILSVTGRTDCGYAPPAALTVTPVPACMLHIALHTPANRELTITADARPNLSIVVNHTGHTVTFQWYRTTALTGGASTLIAGQTSAALSLPAALTTGSHFFYARATAICTAGTAEATSQVFRVNVIGNPADIAPAPAGAGGRLIGRSCFDIAETICSTHSNVPLSVRLLRRANFAVRGSTPQTAQHRLAPFTGYQRYTFTAIGNNVSNVRYLIEDSGGIIDQSASGMPLFGTLHLGTLANSHSVNLDVRFRTDLNTALRGRCRTNAAQATIHIIFFDGAVDRRVSRTISVRDCACCGAGGTPIPWRIGDNYYLVHYFMTNDEERCWMVQNLRRELPGVARNPATGSATVPQFWTFFPGQAQGERGFYYNWHASQIACPPGWNLPTPAQYGTNVNSGGLWTALAAYPRNMALNNPSRFWRGHYLSGWRNQNGVWAGWGSNMHFWSTVSGQMFQADVGHNHFRWWTGIHNARGEALRCIKDQ